MYSWHTYIMYVVCTYQYSVYLYLIGNKWLISRHVKGKYPMFKLGHVTPYTDTLSTQNI